MFDHKKKGKQMHIEHMLEKRRVHNKVEAPCSHQNTISFNIVEGFDLIFGPPATGLLKVFRCTGGRSIMGSRR